jgi:hypothetical protein
VRAGRAPIEDWSKICHTMFKHTGHARCHWSSPPPSPPPSVSERAGRARSKTGHRLAEHGSKTRLHTPWRASTCSSPLPRPHVGVNQV